MRTNHEPRDSTGAWQPAMGRISGLLTVGRGHLDQQSGIKAILALEHAVNYSCCASQVCGCDDPGKDIDAATWTLIGELNAAQEKAGDHAAVRDQRDAVRQGIALPSRPDVDLYQPIMKFFQAAQQSG